MTAQLARFLELLREVDPRTMTNPEVGTATLRLPSGVVVTFWFSRGEFAAAMPGLAEAGHLLWPDVSAELAAFRLLSVHVIEHAESHQPLGRRGYRLEDGIFVPWD